MAAQPAHNPATIDNPNDATAYPVFAPSGVVESARIAHIAPLQGDYYLAILDAPEVAERSAPGQFVMVSPSDSADPLLPRPFSIHRIRTASGEALGSALGNLDNLAHLRKPGQIELLFKRIGPGTNALASKAVGADLRLLGPQGHPFRTFEKSPTHSHIALVAGGYGVAPLYSYARAIRARHPFAQFTLFYGARTQTDFLLLDLFRELNVETILSTNDGTAGFKGFITPPLFERIEQGPANWHIAACGPTPMLEAVGRYSVANDVSCEVSLENYMPCGYGVCLGCVVKNAAGRFCTTCREGPVFDARFLFAKGIENEVFAPGTAH